MTQEFAQRAERESILHRRERSPEQPVAVPPRHPLVQLSATVGNQHVARMVAQREAEEDIQAKHDVQRAAEEDEEVQAKHDVQREPEEEEDIQAKHDIQREAEEEEDIQAKHDIRRESEGGEGEDEEVQAKHDVQRASEEDEDIQAKHEAQPKPEVGLEGGPVSQDVQDRINSARGNGTGLPVGFKEKMESSFGADFSDVKVHRDSEADSLNRTITAKAFTIGSDIFLRNDVGDTDHHTLAHELTHVVQQRSGLGGGGGSGMQVGAADDHAEHEADATANAVLSGAPAQRRTDEE